MPEFSWFELDQVVPAQREQVAAPALPAAEAHAEVLRIFAQLRAPLLRYLGSLGLPLQEGEDVVQDTFLALYVHLLNRKPQQNLDGWTFRVARNLALKQLQRVKPPVATVAAMENAILDPAANPEQLALGESEDRIMQAVIAALPDLDRQCLWLRAEGLRYRDIASTLGLSLGTVSQILARSLGKISRATQREGSLR